MNHEQPPVRRVNEQTSIGRYLLPPEIAKELPKIGATQEQGLAALAQVRYYEPDTFRVWYAVESDGKELFYGLVVDSEAKLMTFTLGEMGRLTGDVYLVVERDVNFTPTALGELKAKHEAELRELEQLALEQVWCQRELADMDGWLEAGYEDRTWLDEG